MKTKLQYIVLLIVLTAANSCSKEPAENSTLVTVANAVEVEQELLAIVNEHRTALGYSTLSFSTVAYTYTNSHIDYMISKGSISHDNWSARASNITAEVNAQEVSENVAKDYESAQKAFQNWMASSPHRKAIEGNFTHTAVSVKKDPEGNLYYMQLFYR